MTTTALVKEGCGTHFVHDQGELERHLKLGWVKRPDDWKDKKREADRVRRLELAKAEQERLAAEVAALESTEKAPESAEKRGPGRPRKGE
jgi:hypothetical protein